MQSPCIKLRVPIIFGFSKIPLFRKIFSSYYKKGIGLDTGHITEVDHVENAVKTKLCDEP
jgi:hypothetical protein